MRVGRVIPAVSIKRKTYLSIIFLASTLFVSQTALAQSGRRQKGSVSSPTPPAVVNEPKVEPAANPPAAKPKPAASLIVGGDKFGASIYVSSYVDIAVQACIGRLRESKGFEVAGGGNMTRKDAIDRAKKEQDAYVLWLELKAEDDANSNTVVISYSVFTPQTAKIMSSGRVYLGARSVGKGGVSVGVPSVSRRLPLQYQIEEGGQEVADRVRGKLHAGLPD